MTLINITPKGQDNYIYLNLNQIVTVYRNGEDWVLEMTNGTRVWIPSVNLVGGDFGRHVEKLSRGSAIPFVIVPKA